MYYATQTLRQKGKKVLVRLLTSKEERESVFAWGIGKETPLIDKFGNTFFDDINNYTHIEDELGRAYSNPPKKGQFVDESAEKYLVGKKELMKMRTKRLLAWEKEVLTRMTTDAPKPYCDVKNKYVLCPFSDGSYCHLAATFFLRRRNAKPLYKQYNSIHKRFTNGPMIFEYRKQTWMYNYMMNHLTVIKL